MEKISGYELFSLTLLFQIGSTILFGFGSDAGRDAWIAALLANMLGAITITLYITLARMQPGLSLVQWFPSQLGRWLGTPIAWIYPFAFMYDAGRVLRDFGDFIITILLPRTPLSVVMGLFMLVVGYSLFLGIETLARTCQLAFPILFLLSVFEILGVLSSDILEIRELLPILQNGWAHIWKTVWPLNVTVPYGETLVFAMIWAYLNQPGKIMKFTLPATLIYGVLIALGDAMVVATLGDNSFKRSIYPMHFLLRQISIANFIQNLDAIVVIQAVVVGFFKVSILMFGAVRGIRQLTKIPNDRILIVPIAIIIICMAIVMASNVPEHMETGLKIVPNRFWVPLFIVLPSVLLITAFVRKKLNK